MSDLVPFVCPKCKKWICDTVAKATVLCPKCKKWVKGEK